MSALLTPLGLGMKVPPLRWTVKQFHDLGEAGIFENRRPFLINGTIFEQGKMNSPHATALTLSYEVVRGVFNVGWVVRNQLPLVFGLHTDPMPDLAVVRGRARDFTTHPTSAELVVEVSDTTLDTDLTEKAELYATAGVPEYWVLDLNSRVLHVLRDPGPLAVGGTAYRAHRKLGPDDIISPLASPGRDIKVTDLLP